MMSACAEADFVIAWTEDFEARFRHFSASEPLFVPVKAHSRRVNKHRQKQSLRLISAVCSAEDADGNVD